MNISVVGGGTGTYSVLTGLKTHPHLKINAIITSFDSGGSTGKLRDEFGYLPIGDFRQALTALGNGEENSLLRKLFNYRFTKGGDGLTGHNLGNLILTALTDILGNENAAIEHIGSVFEIGGKIIPITLKREIILCAQYQNGKIVHGEKLIDDPKIDHDHTVPISSIWLEPNAPINPHAKRALTDSKLVIFGPGDFYTSVMPNTLVDGFKSTIKKSPAKLIFVMNLINKIGQTYGMTTTDYLEKFKMYVGKYPDCVIINNTPLPEDLLAKYAAEGSLPIENNFHSTSKTKVILTDLLATSEIKTIKGDTLKRSLIRHDSEKLAKELLKLI